MGIFFSYLLISLLFYVIMPIFFAGSLLWIVKVTLRRMSPKTARAYDPVFTIIMGLIIVLPIAFYVVRMINEGGVPLLT